jgi:hypothetical protein
MNSFLGSTPGVRRAVQAFLEIILNVLPTHDRTSSLAMMLSSVNAHPADAFVPDSVAAAVLAPAAMGGRIVRVQRQDPLLASWPQLAQPAHVQLTHCSHQER